MSIHKKATMRPVVYLGFNDPRVHARGVENVIRLQSLATVGPCYYIFRANHMECFRWKNIIAISVPTNYFYAFICINGLLRKIARHHGTPIVHAHQYLLALITVNRKLIFTVHDALRYHKMRVGARGAWLYAFVEFMVYLKADKIHAISQFAWNQATGHRLFQPKTSIIYNSIWASEVSMDTLEVNVNSKQNYYLVVRSIEERANLELIIEFSRMLQSDNSDYIIKVVGKGPLLKKFQDLIKAEGFTNIEFLGYVDDLTLDGLYRRASCVIMPALYGEGFGLPLIEAYARGVPAVGASICAIPEVIYSPSLLFENNIVSLKMAIQKAMGIDPVDLREHFQCKFGQAKILSSYREMYENL